jgi:hypothetical protein
VIHIRIIRTFRSYIGNLLAVVEISHAAIESPFHFNSHRLIENLSTRSHEAHGVERYSFLRKVLREKIDDSWRRRDNVWFVLREQTNLKIYRKAR